VTAADYLIPAINIHNESDQKWSNDSTDLNREIFKAKRNKLNKLKRKVIGRWMEKIVSECNES
jgi:dihydropteroate synthase